MRWMVVIALLSLARPSRADVAPEPPASEPRAPSGYHLPPDRYARAVALAHAEQFLYFGGALYGLAVLAALLRGRVAGRYRAWAERVARRRFVQLLVYVPLFAVTLLVLTLPLGIHTQWLQTKYGLSVQSWGSWFADWLKGGGLAIALGVPVAWVLYAVMRRSPRRWWLYFWLAAIPIVIFLQFVAPVVIEPLYFKFWPLTERHAALAEDLERVVKRGGLDIPTSRMFEMYASEKVVSLNAYVDGIGSTKRVVVWDTTISRMSAPEIMAVFGHEMGHYVLGHVAKGIAFALGGLLIFLWLAYRAMNWTIAHYGAKLDIRGADDLSSLPLLLLLLGALAFFSSPISSAFSRHLEHQADIYSLRAIRGLVPDYRAAVANAFQIVGEVDLADPAPNRFIVFWLYDHPPIADRIDYALRYEPPPEEVPWHPTR